MTTFRPLLRTAMAAATVVAVFGVLDPSRALAQDKAGKGDKAEPAETVREAIGKILQAAQELHKAQKYAEALARLKEADGIADRTPFENYWVDRLRGSSAVGAGDAATAEAAFKGVLASGRVPDSEKLQVIELLIAAFQRAKDHGKTVEWTTRYFRDGGKRADVRVAHINALYLTGDFAGTARELLADMKPLEAAGQVPAEANLKLLGSSQIRANDEAGYEKTLERLAAHYPTKDIWADLYARVRKRAQSPDRLTLEWYRLKQDTAGLRGAAEYQHMAQLAFDAGFPVEAAKILEHGFASGVLGAGVDASRHAAQRDRIAKEAAEDSKSLTRGDKPWLNAKNGIALVNYGYSFVLEGQSAQGLSMMEEGLVKGGLKNADDSRLHLAVAYARSGQKDKALQAFAAVQGTDGAKEIARLWKLHLQRPAR